jgi:hypothetical protein
MIVCSRLSPEVDDRMANQLKMAEVQAILALVREDTSDCMRAQLLPGTFSTLPVHIVLEKISGIERGTTWLLRRIECIGPHATQWVSEISIQFLPATKILRG